MNASQEELRDKNVARLQQRVEAERKNLPARINLGPTSFSELEKFTKLLSNSNFVPAAMKGKPGDILAAVQFGAEIGLPPMQALQNIAVINGKPSIYGDAIPGICMTHPDWEGYEEEFDEETMTATCSVRRRGMKPKVSTFSQADAEQAGLWRKAGPWTQYPKRMLAWRAKGFAFRDAFPDALKGLISREEAGDYITLPAGDYHPVAPPPPPAPEPEPEPEPDTLLPSELDMHIKDMESAFERGDGDVWWAKNQITIWPRCTKEQKKRFYERKEWLKGAGASSESAVSPPSEDSGGAPKPRGRPRKTAEPSETSQPDAEGEGRSEALLSLVKVMKEHHAHIGSVSGFYDAQFQRINALSEQDRDWLQSEADALEGKG